jgi:hypothetical protein
MKRRTLVTALLLLTALVVTGIVIAGGSSEPQRPPWIDAQGRLKQEGLPASFEVAGPDGEAVVCANGKRLRVKKADLVGPPPAPPSAVAGRRDPGQDLVWRCGRGADPHLNARLVPESEDPLGSGE